MPRTARPWFRFYVEALHDRKIRRLTPAQRWLWVAVLGCARKSPVPGVLLVAEGQPIEAEDLADVAALPKREVARALPLFEQAGMIGRDEPAGAWRVLNWDERQFETDNTTARTRKHRSQERSNGVGRNVPTASVGTPPETETETDPPTPPTNSRSEPPAIGEEDTDWDPPRGENPAYPPYARLAPDRQRWGPPLRNPTAGWARLRDLMADQLLDDAQADGTKIRDPARYRAAIVRQVDAHRDDAIRRITNRIAQQGWADLCDLEDIAERLDDRCGPSDHGNERQRRRIAIQHHQRAAQEAARR